MLYGALITMIVLGCKLDLVRYFPYYFKLPIRHRLQNYSKQGFSLLEGTFMYNLIL